jgi:hypothetical protein
MARKAGLTMGSALKAAAGGKAEKIELALLKLDGGTQPRQMIDAETVATYSERMERKSGIVVDPEGRPFDPLIVYFDGEHHWLADGFHRADGARKKGYVDFQAEVRQGTQRDAVAYSLGANATHGKPRTNADKRRVVVRALSDREWSLLSDREIARLCAVTHPLVGKVRAELELQRIEARVVTPSTFSPTTEQTADDLEGIAQYTPGKVLKRGGGGELSELHQAAPPAPAQPLFEPRHVPLQPEPEPLAIPRVGIAVLREAPKGKLCALIIREPLPLPLTRAISVREVLKPHGVYLVRLYADSTDVLSGSLYDLDAGWLIRMVRIGEVLWGVVHRRGALFPNYFKDEAALMDELSQMGGEIWELR